MIKSYRMALSFITALVMSVPTYSSLTLSINSSDSEEMEQGPPEVFSSWSRISRAQFYNDEIREKLGNGVSEINLDILKPTIVTFAVRVDDSLRFSEAKGPLEPGEVRHTAVPSMTGIDLGNLQIGCIIGLSYFKQLETLRLCGNLLEILPSDLKSLKLKWLDITNNPYKTVPEYMFAAMNVPGCPLYQDPDLRIAYENTALIKFLEHNGCIVVQKHKESVNYTPLN